MRVGMEWLIPWKWLSWGECADSDITNPQVVALETKFFRVPKHGVKDCVFSNTQMLHVFRGPRERKRRYAVASRSVSMRPAEQAHSKLWPGHCAKANGSPGTIHSARPFGSQHASNRHTPLIGWVVAETPEKEPTWYPLVKSMFFFCFFKI